MWRGRLVLRTSSRCASARAARCATLHVYSYFVFASGCARISRRGRPVHAPRDRSAAPRSAPRAPRSNRWAYRWTLRGAMCEARAAARRRCAPRTAQRCNESDVRVHPRPSGTETRRGRLVPHEVGGTEPFMRRTRDAPSLPASTQSRGRVDVGVKPESTIRGNPVLRECGNPGTRTDAIRGSMHDQRRAQRPDDAKRCEAGSANRQHDADAARAKGSTPVT